MFSVGQFMDIKESGCQGLKEKGNGEWEPMGTLLFGLMTHSGTR